MSKSVVSAIPRQQLEEAFLMFSQAASELADSYLQLQLRIGQLSEELAAARSGRMKELTEKEHYAYRFAQLLDSLPAAVVVVGADDRVAQYNPAASELFPALATGVSWAHIARHMVSTNTQKNELKLNTGAVVSFTERRLAGESGRIMLMLDITETRRLQQRAARQQRLSVMGEMAAKLAHQIRTPLTSALLYNSHLSRDDLSSERRARFSQKSRRCLLNMERQINDMLCYAKGSDFEHRPLDLNELLKELRQTLEPIARERNIILNINTVRRRAMVDGDRMALLGALMNIAVNALDHSPDDGVITLTLTDGEECWELHIDDQGPGVPEALHKQIFEPFFTTRNQGTGLGLAVSRAVAMGHGGDIQVGMGVAGKGSRFRFRLPRLEGRESPVQDPMSYSSSSNSVLEGAV